MSLSTQPDPRSYCGLKVSTWFSMMIVAVLCMLLIHACSGSDNQLTNTRPIEVQPVQQAQQTPQPVIVQSQPQPVVVHDSDNGGFFSGMLMGHLMSSSSHSYHSHMTVVHRYSSPRYSAPARYYGSRGFTRRSTYRSTFRSYGRR